MTLHFEENSVELHQKCIALELLLIKPWFYYRICIQILIQIVASICITLANKEKKNDRTTATYYILQTTVHDSDLRFFWNQKVFTKSCSEVTKIIIFSILKI